MAFGRGIAITSHDVVTRTLHVTRSEDFGGMAWSEPLEVLTRSLDREARLTPAGRKRARDLLVDVLVARRGAVAAAAEAASSEPIVRPSPAPRAVGSLDGALATAAAARATGVAADDARWCDLTFASLGFEERWHVPSYAEWLAEADLGELYGQTLVRVAPPVLAGTLLLEQAAALRTVGVAIEVVDCDLDAAIEATAARSVARRRETSDDVDPEKVHRYWAWRLGVVAERFGAAR